MAEAAPPASRFFRRPPPSSPDAYRIWNDCCLGDIMEVMDIYWALDTWARHNCLILMKEERPYVFWISESGVRHECFADTFAHWVLCACEEINANEARSQLPPPPPPLTPINGMSPTWNEEDALKCSLGANSTDQSERLSTDDQVPKIDDVVDNIMIEALRDDELTSLKFDEILNMNLEQFLAECSEEGSETTEEH